MTDRRDLFYTTPSRLGTALSCPLRYHRQYVQKIDGGKTSLSMFVGKRQHEALEGWAAKGDSLLVAFERGWETELPGELAKLWIEAVLTKVERAGVDTKLEELAAQIQVDRPEIKKPKATKEYGDAVEAAGGKTLDEKIEKLTAQARVWANSEASPWKPSKLGPIEAYDDALSALQRFGRWWDERKAAGDGGPEILHTETKERLELDGRYAITGVIDAAWLWPDGSTEVVDYKKSGGKDGPLQHFCQAAVYALTCEQVFGFAPDRVVFHHLQEGERLIFDVQPGWTERLLELCDRLKAMHDGNLFNPSFRTCTWCDYEPLCKEWLHFEPHKEAAAA